MPRVMPAGPENQSTKTPPHNKHEAREQGPPDPLELLTKREVAALVKCNAWTLDRWRRDRPDFPKPVWLSDVIMRWWRRDIEAWLLSRQKGGLSPAWENGNQPHKNGSGR